MTRDNQWLQKRAKGIWQRYFPDVKIANNIFVRFGREARTRLGSIKHGTRKENPNTYITITGLFRDPEIPEFVVDATLAHEISHYSHGFFSPRERAFRHPHKGGIIRKEFNHRGLEDLYKISKKWLRLNWRDYIKRKYGTIRLVRRRRSRRGFSFLKTMLQ